MWRRQNDTPQTQQPTPDPACWEAQIIDIEEGKQGEGVQVVDQKHAQAQDASMSSGGYRQREGPYEHTARGARAGPVEMQRWSQNGVVCVQPSFQQQQQQQRHLSTYTQAGMQRVAESPCRCVFKCKTCSAALHELTNVWWPNVSHGVVLRTPRNSVVPNIQGLLPDSAVSSRSCLVQVGSLFRLTAVLFW